MRSLGMGYHLSITMNNALPELWQPAKIEVRNGPLHRQRSDRMAYQMSSPTIRCIIVHLIRAATCSITATASHVLAGSF